MAPIYFQANLNGDILGWYVEEVLRPQLKAGQMVILDHLSCHQVSAVEECWSKIKAFLRGPAGQRLEELEKYIAKTLEQYSGMVKALWILG